MAARVLLRYLRAPNAPAKKTSGSLRGEVRSVVDAAYDDPVIAGGVLGEDLTLECGEGVGEQWYAVGSEFPVEVGESVRAGRGRAFCERLVLPS